MKLLGIHHVSLMVPELEPAVDFYVRVLGLTLRTDRPDFGFDGAWLDAGDQQVHLIVGAAPDRVGQHFALRVEDIEAAVAELRAGGFDVPDPRVTGVGRQTVVLDPAGNQVELNQPDR